MVAIIPACKQAKSVDTLHSSGRRAFALNTQGKRPSSPAAPPSLRRPACALAAAGLERQGLHVVYALDGRVALGVLRQLHRYQRVSQTGNAGHCAGQTSQPLTP